MATQNLELAGPIKRTIKGHENWYYGGGEEAYQDRASALASVPVPVRIGQTVGIYESGKIVEYWWNEVTTDEGLVLKVVDTTGGGTSTRFGIEDNTGVQDRYVDLQDKYLIIDNASEYYFTTLNSGNVFSMSTNGYGVNFPRGGINGFVDPSNSKGLSRVYGQNAGGGFSRYLSVYEDEVQVNRIENGVETGRQTFPNITGNYFIPLSVNGSFADSTGNITLDLGSGGGGTASRFGVAGEDDLAAQNRYIDIAAHDFDISNASHIHLGTSGSGGSSNLHIYDSAIDLSSFTSGQGTGGFQANATLAQISYNQTGSQKRVRINPNGIEFYQYNTTTDFDGIIRVPFVGAASTLTRYMPLSVNGIFANSNGNITLDLGSGGGGSSLSLTTTGLNTPATYDSGTGVLNVPNYSTRFGLEDTDAGEDRTFFANNHDLHVYDANEVGFFAFNGTYGASIMSTMVGQDGDSRPFSRIQASSNTPANTRRYIKVMPDAIKYRVNNELEAYLPLTVNGNFADAAGNITVATGGGGTALSLTTTGTNGASTYDSGTGVLNIPDYSYTLPLASGSVLGGIKVGTGLTIDGSGVLSATGGGGGTASRFGIEDTTTPSNRNVDLSFRDFNITGTGGAIMIKERDSVDNTKEAFLSLNTGAAAFGFHLPIASGNDRFFAVNVSGDAYIYGRDSISFEQRNLKFVKPATSDRYSPISVNQYFADATGNITLPVRTVLTVTGTSNFTFDPTLYEALIFTGDNNVNSTVANGMPNNYTGWFKLVVNDGFLSFSNVSKYGGGIAGGSTTQFTKGIYDIYVANSMMYVTDDDPIRRYNVTSLTSNGSSTYTISLTNIESYSTWKSGMTLSIYGRNSGDTVENLQYLLSNRYQTTISNYTDSAMTINGDPVYLRGVVATSIPAWTTWVLQFEKRNWALSTQYGIIVKGVMSM